MVTRAIRKEDARPGTISDRRARSGRVPLRRDGLVGAA